MRSIIAGALVVGLLAGTAAAEIESRSQSGFVVAYEADLAIPPQDAYAKWLQIGGWWSPVHTYSGDSKNLSITPDPGGCWCEALKDGGFVVHLRVVSAQPGKALLFSGGLGPLAYMGVAGSMVVEFKATATGTHVTLRYAVGGYDPSNFAALPAAVDGVLGEGFQRYAAFAAQP
ncbi:MAG: hypothetical protein IT548_17695 [Alphaproteobacteria bacterium]|nr:hypothetical protein [Alphaproteobacteria bacterium]